MLRRRFILAAGGVAATIGALSLLDGIRRGDPDSEYRRAADLGRRYGMRIALYGFPPSHAKGQDVRLPEIPGGSATGLLPEALPWALDGLEPSLGLYPDGFYGRLCATIYLCGTLTLDGHAAGGTYGDDWIILSAPAAAGGSTIEKTCLLGVHHEFSSIVWSRTPTLPGRWATLVPAGWSFAESTGRALDIANTPPPPSTTGFLSAYGSSTAENDFNVYAETVFTEPARLVDLAKQQRVIRAKLALLLDAYVDLDPRMGDVFRRLGVGALIGASSELVPGGLGLSPSQIPSGRLVTPE